MTTIGTPATLPDAAAVSEASAAFSSIATQTTEATDAVATGWAGLSAPGVYQAPEADRVHVAMDAPKAVAEIVAGDVKQVQRVLDAYATVLTDLATRRATLLSDISSHDTAVRDAADAPADSDPDGTGADALATAATDLAGRVRTFNADVEAADADCASGLRALAKYAGVTQIRNVVDAAAGNVSGTAIGLAEEATNRVRRLEIAVETRSIETIKVLPVLEWKGTSFATRPGSTFLIPEHTAQSYITQPEPDVTTKSRFSMVWDDGATKSALPKVAEVGGRALGVAGTVLTVGSAYADQYQEDSQTHPEWTEGEKQASATENAVFVGGGSAAGAWGGAIVGAEIGATIGSVFPGPGTAIGGIVGGIAGGIVGSGIGEDIGKAAKGLWDKITG